MTTNSKHNECRNGVQLKIYLSHQSFNWYTSYISLEVNFLPHIFLNKNRIRPSNFGSMDVSCRLCRALHWTKEKTWNHSSSSVLNPDDLYTGSYANATHFLNILKQCISASAFTSFGAKRIAMLLTCPLSIRSFR
ncbi:hypothetical protein BDB01DRAFT_852606 [Pilobolus umbonatus]|nr:hypothetical protein BDB01DRAFT_852606 [Pilobolus umbonatus]